MKRTKDIFKRLALDFTKTNHEKFKIIDEISFTFAVKKEKITKRESNFFQKLNPIYAGSFGFGSFDGDNVCAWKSRQSDYGSIGFSVVHLVSRHCFWQQTGSFRFGFGNVVF